MFCFFSFLFLKLLTVGRLFFFFHHKHCFLFLFVSLMIALQLLSFLVPQARCLHVATGNVTPVNTLSFPSISSRPHRLTLTFTVGIPYLYFFFSPFTVGSHQDCTEAGGDGLPLSGNRSAGAGAGEKSGIYASMCVCVSMFSQH